MAEPDDSNARPISAPVAAVVPTRVEDLSELARLASLIWHAHYPGIISTDQIEYMLGEMYSHDRLRRELLMEGVVYLHIGSPGAMVGFAAVGPTPDPSEFKLHKLYVHPDHQRKRYGKALLQAAAVRAREAGGKRLALCVNKRNTTALQAYRAYGFRQRAEVCVDIGGGFVMDDYVLEYELGVSGGC
ncbi:MAG: GNAT family N-acetyltransferase [Verrucomicrobiales bacterium]|nr:GNAT family N-acetyltransferase [Verrucomicrobiales bacterium]